MGGRLLRHGIGVKKANAGQKPGAQAEACPTKQYTIAQQPMPARTISHYEVLEKLGSGGMGVVYKARDRRLGRFLALKLLPPESVADPARRHRFLQEAKAASALNHPNIITIYDVGDCPDGLFLAMEYVSGKTVASLLTGEPLPAAQALQYAAQAAGALAAAHEAGIVHRDIKPANLMVTAAGQVKVLDFGIAKLTEPLDESASTVSGPPLTGAGDLVGTVAYMSPEQAEGRPVDGRSDLFSLGATMYEMLAGCRPFRASTRLGVLTAILREQPEPLAKWNPAVPAEVARVVVRCLEKDPAQRFQHAADLKLALEWLAQDLAAGRLGAAPPPAPRPGRKPLLVLVLVAVAAAAVALYRFRPASAPPAPAATMVTFGRGLAAEPALSADGKLLAYASDSGGEGNLDIWVRQLGTAGDPIQRTRDPADDTAPSFSPDGGSIAFMRRRTGVFIVPALAGEERLVAPAGCFPRFSRDGKQIAYWVGEEDNPAPSGRVFVIALDGGAARPLAADFADARYPRWAPDGDHLLFQGRRSPDDEPEWWIVPLENGAPVNTGILALLRRRGLEPYPGPGDWLGDRLVFSVENAQGRHLWQLLLKPPAWRVAGPPEQLTSGGSEEADPSLGPGGRLAYSSWIHHNNLWRLALGDDGGTAAAVEHLSGGAAHDVRPSISVDGKTLAFLSRRSETTQIWTRNLVTSHEEALTIGPTEKSSPAMAPDGLRVAYSVLEDRTPSIYITSIPQRGEPIGVARRACRGCGEPSDWSRDSRKILYIAGRPPGVQLLDPDSGASRSVLRHPQYNLGQAHLSPDGRWIAFVATVGPDRTRIFVAPFREGAMTVPSEWIAVTEGAAWDDKPRWLNADSLVYYSTRDRFGCLWKQRLDPAGKRPLGPPSPVYHFHALQLSLRTQSPGSFDLAVAGGTLIVNLVEMTGNIWLTTIPGGR